MRWLYAVLAFTGGLAVGLVGLLVHRHAVWLGGWPLPWGALLALAAAVGVAVLLRRRVPTLLGFLFGWLTSLLIALADGPGGDFVLLSDLLGWGYLIASVLAIAVVLGLGAPRRRVGPQRTTGSTQQPHQPPRDVDDAGARPGRRPGRQQRPGGKKHR